MIYDDEESLITQLEEMKERVWETEVKYREALSKQMKATDQLEKLEKERDFYKGKTEKRQTEAYEEKGQKIIRASRFLTKARKAASIGRPPIEILAMSLEFISEPLWGYTRHGEEIISLYRSAGEIWGFDIGIKEQEKRLEKLKESFEQAGGNNLRLAIEYTEQEIIRLKGEFEEDGEESA